MIYNYETPRPAPRWVRITRFVFAMVALGLVLFVAGAIR